MNAAQLALFQSIDTYQKEQEEKRADEEERAFRDIEEDEDSEERTSEAEEAATAEEETPIPEQEDAPAQIEDNAFTQSVISAAEQASALFDVKESSAVSKRALTDGLFDTGVVLPARKNAQLQYQASLECAAKAEMKYSLKEDWPNVNYKKLEEVGLEPWKIAALRALRESMPNKPRNYYHTCWRNLLTDKRDLAIAVLQGEYTEERFRQKVMELGKIENEASRSGLKQVENYYTNTTLEDDRRANFSHCLDLYDGYCRFGEDVNLQNYFIGQNIGILRGYGNGYSVFKTTSRKDDAHSYIIRYKPFTHLSTSKTYGALATNLASREEAYAQIRAFLKQDKEKAEEDSKTKTGSSRFHTFSYFDKTEDAYRYGIAVNIGRKTVLLKKGFDSSLAASAYKAEHPNDLKAALKAAQVPYERNETDAPRTGTRHRPDGHNITAQELQDTFGFIGIQFGNWVEDEKRQAFVNETYDALFDLATAIHIPPRALSLSGTLGLQFGSNGRGGKHAAMAHFQLTSMRNAENQAISLRLINLTKTKGGGCLAHEWFHALDSYLGEKASMDWLTPIVEHGSDLGKDCPLREETVKGLAQAVSGALHDPATKWSSNFLLRCQTMDLTKRKPYWSSTVEMMARSFEAYVQDSLKQQGIRNDFLVNFRSEEEWDKAQNENLKNGGELYPYVYPYKEELPTIAKGFDHLFSSLQTREKDGHLELFSCTRHDTLEAQIEASRPILPADYTQEERTIAAVSQELGIPVQFYEGPATLHGHFSPSSDTMYLNRDSEATLPWTFYHEAFHVLRNEDPDLYKDILTFIEKKHAITGYQIDAFRRENHAMNLSDAAVKEELLANAFADQKTARHLIYQMAEEKPSLAGRFLRFTKRLAHRAADFLQKRQKNSGRLSSLQMQDFSDALDILTEQMTVRGGKRPLSKAENILTLQGEPVFPEDCRGIRRHITLSTRGKQMDHDLRFAIEMLKSNVSKDRQHLIGTLLKQCSPLGKDTDYCHTVVKKAMRAFQMRERTK